MAFSWNEVLRAWYLQNRLKYCFKNFLLLKYSDNYKNKVELCSCIKFGKKYKVEYMQNFTAFSQNDVLHACAHDIYKTVWIIASKMLSHLSNHIMMEIK